MSHKIYAMEASFLTQLLSDRKELMEIARTFKTAGEMREAREDLMLSLSDINITPRNAEQIDKSYFIDAEGTAHIPIIGELTPHAETDICGAYTANALTEYGFIVMATMAADDDDRVEQIQFDINSPGGYVDGLMPAVDAIRSAEKETLAFVDGMAASAAYWLASQTDKIVAASPASRVGSIGVAVEIFDFTEALKMEGIEKIILTSTDAPLKRPDVTTEEGQGLIVDSLDDTHKVFVQYVAEGRGIDPGEVTEKYGRGGVLIAENALTAGMIDSIEKVPARRNAETILDVVQTDTVVKAGEIKQEVEMENLDELKKENPGLFAEAVEIGIKQERERVTELRTYIEADPDNVKLAEVVNTAIAGGQMAGEISAKVQVAIRDGGKLAGENAPAVETAESVDGLSEDDQAAAKEAGMSIEDYKKSLAYLNKEGK